MVQNESDWVERSHRQAMEEHIEQVKLDRALVVLAHEPAKRHRADEEQVRQTVEETHHQAAELQHTQLSERGQSPSVHCTDLAELPADSPIRQEWNTYRREAPRLIREGLEGRFALINGDTIAGIFDSFEEGLRTGRQKFLMQPFLVQPIREREPLLTIRGHALPCPNSVTRSPRVR